MMQPIQPIIIFVTAAATEAAKKADPTTKSKLLGWSWAAASWTGQKLTALASKALAPAATLATWVAAPAVYTWWPVKPLTDNIAVPIAENVISGLGFSVPVPAQMLFAFVGYEKAKKHFWSKELDLKRAAVATILTLAVAQDPTAQRIVRAAMTPTVLGTVGLCAAIDYANAVATEGKWIPSMVSDMAEETAKKVKTVYSMAAAGARVAQAKIATGMEAVRARASAVAAVAQERWQAAPAA